MKVARKSFGICGEPSAAASFPQDGQWMFFRRMVEVFHKGLATEGKCLLDKVIAVGDFDAADDITMAVSRAKAMQGYVK